MKGHKVELIRIGPGQNVKTADKGAEYVFYTEGGDYFYWDTLSTKLIDRVGDTLHIVCEVKGKREGLLVGEREYDVRNVRLVGGE